MENEEANHAFLPRWETSALKQKSGLAKREASFINEIEIWIITGHTKY